MATPPNDNVRAWMAAHPSLARLPLRTSSQPSTARESATDPEEPIQIHRTKLIRLKFWNSGTSDPIVGSGIIGTLNNRRIPQEDMFINRKIDKDDVTNNVIWQAAQGVHSDYYQSVRAVDDIVFTDYFTNIRKCFYEPRPNLEEHMTLSWFIDRGENLMFNLHLNKETLVRDNIYSMEETETANHVDVKYYIALISALRPHLEPQIRKHLWLDNCDFYCSTHRRMASGKIPPPENSQDFERLYETLRNARKTPPSYHLKLDSLASTLRGYQKEAADFLIHREIETDVNMGFIHEYVQLADYVFYLPSLGAFVRDVSNTTVSVVGGILADEMGLGKTVELLALILTNQSEEDVQELCRTRGNTAEDCTPLLDDNSHDSSIVKDLVGEMVSQVSGVCDGRAALDSMKRVSKLKAYERQANSVHRANATCKPHEVQCADCGEGWPAKKVHWFPEFDDQQLTFKCPTCILEDPPVPVSATLIVVPKSICHQWYEEIKKHVKDDVKIDMYMGVAADGYKNPHYFNQFHIVITTYDVLSKEFQHLQEQTDNYSTRIRKRPYAAAKRVSSPLPCIKWWRVCLDEWQLVTGGRQGEVCFKLQSRAKWCVSGTPLVKNYHDFQNMLRFLQVRPYHRHSTWDLTIYNQHAKLKNINSMVELLSQFFWRNSKKDIEDQLRIPPKKEVVTNVHLSPIETEYYKLKLAETRKLVVNTFLRSSIKNETQIDQIPAGLFRDLMGALNSIRWALVIGEGYLTDDPDGSAKKIIGLTPNDLFDKVVKDTRNLLAVATRAVVANLNELAAFKMRTKKYAEAIDCYLKVKPAMAEFETKVKAAGLPNWELDSEIDMKQQIHSIANLLQAATKCVDKISSDEIVAFKLYFKDLEKSSDNEAIEAVKNAINDLLTERDNHVIKETELEISLPSCKTAVEILDSKRLVRSNIFINKSLASFAQMRPNLTAKNLKESLWKEIEGAFKHRQNQIELFWTNLLAWTKALKIDGTLDSKMTKKMLACRDHTHRPAPGVVNHADDCPLCLMNRSVTDIEEKLWIAKLLRRRTGSSMQSDGTRQAILNMPEYAINFRNELPVSEDPFYMVMRLICQDSSETFVKFQVWLRSCRSFVKSVNSMIATVQLFLTKRSATRMARSRTEHEHHRSLRSSADYEAHITFALEKSERKRKEHHAVLSYVQTLMNKDDETLECPVCYMELETSWKMMPCLHNMCTSCYDRFIKMSGVRQECVVCRAPFNVKDVQEILSPNSVLARSELSNEAVDQYNVKGLKLTFKMAAVTREIVSVLNDDPSNKIIVFSAVKSALEMLSHVFESLDLKHILFKSKSCNLEDLALFKQSYDHNVLLLPISFGANGLNLVEANHIFFMEPIPNASEFQQACGRVFRMGQRRATKIHHLITKDTIEETIHAVVTGGNETGLTVGAFKKIMGIDE